MKKRPILKNRPFLCSIGMRFLLQKKSMHKLIFIIFINFFLSSTLSAMVKKGSFLLERQVKAPLVSLLDEAVYLHEMFYSKNEDQVHLRASKMIQQIRNIRQQQSIISLSHHQRSYMEKLLQDLSSRLESLKISSEPRSRVNNMHAINRQLTYMAKVYGLEKYDVFFCSKDRNVWMKKNTKSKTLHLSDTSCGVSVSKKK